MYEIASFRLHVSFQGRLFLVSAMLNDLKGPGEKE